MGEFSKMVKSSNNFMDKQDNPLIYSLVMAKLTNTDKEQLHDDETLFNVLNKVEEVLPHIDSEKLCKAYNKVSMGVMFNKDTNRKFLPDYINQYYDDFEKTASNSEKTFDGAYKIHKLFKDLRNSNEFQEFIKSI